MTDQKTELRAEISTVTFMILHHKREIVRLTRELDRLENRIDGIYFWREDEGWFEEVSQ